MRRRPDFLALTLVLLSMLVASHPARAQKAEVATVTVFAAASLKSALDEAAGGFTQSTGNKVVASYAASSALARQIEQAAPADVFISADLEWMDHLAGKGLIRADTRVNLLGNRLVLIKSASQSTDLKIEKGFDLAAALGVGRLAVADVKAVPAGKYAKAALESLGVWTSVESRIAQSENVRAALALVARGEAPLGIVYETDARAEPKVNVVGAFPDSSHPAIIYPVAVTQASGAPDAAKALIAYLVSTAGMDIFKKHGFTAPTKP